MARSDFFEHTKSIPTEHCGIFDFQSSTYLLSKQARVYINEYITSLYVVLIFDISKLKKDSTSE
jgi:hypothetical protein